MGVTPLREVFEAMEIDVVPELDREKDKTPTRSNSGI